MDVGHSLMTARTGATGAGRFHAIGGAVGPSSRGLLVVLTVLSFATALATGGCGQKMDTQLPDLATKKAPAGGQQPLSTAQQKKAIDDMIAKRDGKAPDSK
jgi:predicted small lipoprotein YifL